MPTISMFYGIIIRMYYFDIQQHSAPHIHVHYQGDSVIVEIPSGRILEGGIPSNKQKLVDAWVEIHKDELMADWERKYRTPMYLTSLQSPTRLTLSA